MRWMGPLEDATTALDLLNAVDGHLVSAVARP